MGITTFLNLTYLKLDFMCHFSIDQGVLPLRQMSKTLLEKKVMNSLAEAELLMMLSSGRMMSLCLQECIRSWVARRLFAEDILFYVFFSVVVREAREEQFWMSEVEGDTHHLI